MKQGMQAASALSVLLPHGSKTSRLRRNVSLLSEWLVYIVWSNEWYTVEYLFGFVGQVEDSLIGDLLSVENQYCQYCFHIR